MNEIDKYNGESVFEFTGKFHLSFIFQRNSPIRCAKCGGFFYRHNNKYFVCRNMRKTRKEKCFNFVSYATLKAYLADLYDHKKVFLINDIKNIKNKIIVFKNENDSFKMTMSSPYMKDFKNKSIKNQIQMDANYNPFEARLKLMCNYDYTNLNKLIQLMKYKRNLIEGKINLFYSNTKKFKRLYQIKSIKKPIEIINIDNINKITNEINSSNNNEIIVID